MLLVFLGTAAAVPSAERGLPAALVTSGANRLLVDCGEGTQRQLMRAGANKVVSPTLIGSHRMAQAALSPAVADFIELTREKMGAREKQWT